MKSKMMVAFAAERNVFEIYIYIFLNMVLVLTTDSRIGLVFMHNNLHLLLIFCICFLGTNVKCSSVSGY